MWGIITLSMVYVFIQQESGKQKIIVQAKGLFIAFKIRYDYRVLLCNAEINVSSQTLVSGLAMLANGCQILRGQSVTFL